MNKEIMHLSIVITLVGILTSSELFFIYLRLLSISKSLEIIANSIGK